MTSYIAHTSVDCANAYELSEWWKEVLGYVDVPGDPNEPGHSECMIQSPDADHHLLFIEVPDTKSVKNRLHFDLRPSATYRDEEVERLKGIGAREIDDQRDHYAPGVGLGGDGGPGGQRVLRAALRRRAGGRRGLSAGS